ncbi:MAG: YkvA family protein [Candidatus Uhrbacteria bacterium]
MQRTHFLPDWKGLWSFLSDASADWKPKALVIVSIVYLLWPVDLIPDFAPILGWLDDIGFVGFASWYLVHATNSYLETKKKNRLPPAS